MNEQFKNQFEQMFENMKLAIPQVTPNKNGYEIRTKVLEMAQNNVWQDYHARLGVFETKIEKDGDEVVTTVTMPSVPDSDEVVATAQKFYNFVGGSKK